MTGRSLPLRVAELERRLASVIRVATVVELDASNALVRVRDGAFESAWLPWLAHRAGGGEASWDAPEPGERVILFAPCGELSASVVLPAIYCSGNDAPADDADTFVREHADGYRFRYDRSRSSLFVSIPASGEAHINVGNTDVLVKNGEVRVSATKVIIDSDDIRLGGGTGKPVARVGDKVDPNSHIILEGSNVTKST